MSTIEPQRYIGDGVYASLDPARMIILRTSRASIGDPEAYNERHWIALEPEVLAELVVFACELGWRDVVTRALARAPRRYGGADDDE